MNDSIKRWTKRILRLVKMVFFVAVAGVATLLLASALFLWLNPAFGGTPTSEQEIEYARSENYRDGQFINKDEVELVFSMSEMAWIFRELLSSHPNSLPDSKLSIVNTDSSDITDYSSSQPRIIWFGHSTVLLQIDGKNILIDPMFGDVPAPHPWLGPSRFSGGLPIEIERLPYIDAVVLSHDHYDHLDHGSILRLKDKVGAFFVPLGVGNHLRRWGVPDNRITELDWWSETDFQGLQLACVPAQHFSGRGVFDNGATLWASWVIKGEGGSIYFSGDSGYGPHFKEIGDKYGPFDFAMLECGQYNEKWIEIRMLPEETVEAAIDLRAQVMMPIHWAAFRLAFHTWTDPVERVTQRASERGVKVVVPKIGESLQLAQAPEQPPEEWWYQNTGSPE